ncbi:alcohol dehydrogenase catalytic domain-containing protein [Dactylosporangium sp. NPDC049525]|uniref:alcohol dehydrogenase catalytic domain-containing protein n=1 Tax=Dactylosporangium sp. NPDC049525 TaxID=3154730 RepID=UPI00342738A9
MRALITRAGADMPVLTDVEPAPLGPADLRIRVGAAAVNPIDVFLATERGRAVFGLRGGTGLGSDLTGTVIEAGAQVDGFAVGDRVAALDRDPAAPSRAHAESIVVAAADAPACLPVSTRWPRHRYRSTHSPRARASTSSARPRGGACW